MANLDGFGNGIGKLYSTQINGTSFINSGITNDAAGVNTMKIAALAVSPVGTNINAVGIIEINTIAVVGTITTLTVNGVSLFNVAVPITLTVGFEEDAANETAVAINSWTNTSGVNYKASSSGKFVYIVPVGDAGSSVNGHVIAEAHTGTATINLTPMANGSEGNEEYSQLNGVRFWINANTSAVSGSLVGAVEITSYLAMRGTQGGMSITESTINSDGALSARTRSAYIETIEVNAGAPDNLDFIQTTGVTIGDRITLSANNFTVTFRDQSVAIPGNLMLVNQVSMISSTVEEAITLQLFNHPTNGLMWIEINRGIAVIPANSITATQIAAATVSAAEIVLATITNAQIANNTITATQIAAATVSAAEIVLATITNAQIAAGTILVSNLETTLTKEIIVVPVTFETAGEMGLIKVTIPYACNVTAIDAAVTLLIEATDDATIIPKDHSGAAMTTGQIDLTAASPLGNIFSSVPTGNNSFTAGQVLSLETSKTTVGGKALVSVELTRS